MQPVARLFHHRFEREVHAGLGSRVQCIRGVVTSAGKLGLGGRVLVYDQQRRLHHLLRKKRAPGADSIVRLVLDFVAHGTQLCRLYVLNFLHHVLVVRVPYYGAWVGHEAASLLRAVLGQNALHHLHRRKDIALRLRDEECLLGTIVELIAHVLDHRGGFVVGVEELLVGLVKADIFRAVLLLLNQQLEHLLVVLV